jgi:hypothetical protein
MRRRIGALAVTALVGAAGVTLAAAVVPVLIILEWTADRRA